MTRMRIHCSGLALGLLSLLAVPAGRMPLVAASVPRFTQTSVFLDSGSRELRISLKCPRFVFDGAIVGGTLPAAIEGRLARGEHIEVSYPAQACGTNGELEVRLLMDWSGEECVLRKWAEFRLLAAPSPVLLKEVMLEEVELPGD